MYCVKEEGYRVYLKKPFACDRLTGSACLGTCRLYAVWHFPWLFLGGRAAGKGGYAANGTIDFRSAADLPRRASSFS